jgi:hypothetical protein
MILEIFVTKERKKDDTTICKPAANATFDIWQKK